MGLVVNFKTIQDASSHFSDLFLNQRVQSPPQAQGQSNVLLLYSYQYCFYYYIVVFNRQLAFKLDHQVHYTEQQLVILNKLFYLPSQLTSQLSSIWQVSVSIAMPHSSFTYVGSELIIIVWAFVYELNILLPPLSLARFFVTAQTNL